MKTSPSRSRRKKTAWPRRITLGRVSVLVYRRKTPSGNYAFMVANYSDGNRRFDSYSKEIDALDAAGRLARHLSERDVLTASMTRDQTIEYASSQQVLKPLNLSLVPSVTALAEAVKVVGDLSNVIAAAKFYAARHRKTAPKRVRNVVSDLLKVKEARGASKRYLEDLRSRLNRFEDAFCKDICAVTTAEIQEWLDGLKVAPQSYANYRRVVYQLFEFGVARGYAIDNPVLSVEKVKVRDKEIEIYTPNEIARLLAAASSDFLPCLAIGAFAGLRAAEIERLEWSDIHFGERIIVVGASKAKTAGRRTVPISDNLAAWLAPYAESKTKLWRGKHDAFYKAQKHTAAATRIEADPKKRKKAQVPVKWKANALRHSYASYRFAEIGDAGRLAGEMGNSASIVHRFYRELVKPADAKRWFSIRPASPANVVPVLSEIAHA